MDTGLLGEMERIGEKMRRGWREEGERWREGEKIDRRRVLLSLGAVRSIGCGIR